MADVAAGGRWALWLASWWGLKGLLWEFDPSIYVLCLSLATHVRVPPPFGQVPPLLDVFIVYFQCFSPFCSLLFGTLALCYRSPTWLLSSASCAWAAFGRPCWPRRGAQRPARPWLTMLHPYFYWFYRRVPGYGGGEVHIERLWPSGLEAPIDVWYEAGAAPPRPRPILLNVHGGAWRGGEARISPQAPIWQTLAAQGFLIVSCEYRRRRAQWPDQLDDCRAALMWLVREGAAQFHGDLEDLTIAGASAGGHLVALLLAEAVKKQLPLPVTFRAALLFYPALDPADRCRSTVRLPFSCSLLGVRYQMSALEWFFEFFVLKSQRHCWSSAEPLKQLQELRKEQAAAWPPTLVVHGERDGVVPVEHSREFLKTLAELSEEGGVGLRSCDQLLEIPGGRHTFEIVYCDLSDMSYDCTLAWLHQLRSVHKDGSGQG
ncbi:unnamed protein product [Durusdinium trenchii]|uniref:Alpha/beta hydrolase fold-3 domain-containing protein n=1 Tax=Durusdinium trenchii TaxID=1381693 RepID=A0ABP0SWC7_9DINO